MKIMMELALRFVVSCLCLVPLCTSAQDLAFPTTPTVTPADDRIGSWPIQAMPKTLLRLDQGELPSPRTSSEMTAQSVAGLAAKAVNERRGDEMVWIDNGNANIEEWYVRLCKRHPNLEAREKSHLWDLIDHFEQNGTIKGYILYKADDSTGEMNEHRPGINISVNVATSLAGLLNGIVVDESLEQEAKAHGLKRLIDVRDRTQAWCFSTYRDQFNRRIICAQDPRKPNIRDLAIAQKAIVVYGNEEPTPAVMKWLEPLSPVVGWNGGDEFKTTELSSRWGHIQTATDWCINLPVLMAGTEHAVPSKQSAFDPRTIDWNDNRSAVSFVSSDGDNVQWFEGNFFRNRFWSNPERGTIPFGWSCCFANLARLCPEAIDYAVATRTPNDRFIEWGGGYYYPDLFSTNRPNRWQLLAQQARRTWEMMKANNTRMIGFNVALCDSPAARNAYEVFASQTEGLLGILVFQYAPYEGGAGKTFWVKDANGIELPVITARYSIWEHANHRERAGTPAKVAREIRQTVENTPREQRPRYDWTICHVWSHFKKSLGNDENEENLPQSGAAAAGGECGYSPAVWCAKRLTDDIRVVSPDEMVWRIRMQHNPKQTKQLISQLK